MKILWRRIARNRENRGFGREGASEKQKGEKKIVWVRGARVSRAKPVATGKRRASIAVSPLEDAGRPRVIRCSLMQRSCLAFFFLIKITAAMNEAYAIERDASVSPGLRDINARSNTDTERKVSNVRATLSNNGAAG